MSTGYFRNQSVPGVAIANGAIDTAQLADDAANVDKVLAGVADDNIVTVDQGGGLTDNQLVRATANGVETLSDLAVYTQLKTQFFANSSAASAAKLLVNTEFQRLDGALDTNNVGSKAAILDASKNLAIKGDIITSSGAGKGIRNSANSVTMLDGDGKADLDSIKIGGNVFVDASANISGARSLTTTGDVVVGANLTVNGTTTTINASTLEVEDKNIELGKVSTPTNLTANGGGITLLAGAGGNKTITFSNANSAWESSEHWNIASGKAFKINNATLLDVDGAAKVKAAVAGTGLNHGAGQLSVKFGSAAGDACEGNDARLVPALGNNKVVARNASNTNFVGLDIGTSNGNLLKASSGLVNGNFPRVTATGIESRTASQIRGDMGLDSMATQASTNVSISGGVISCNDIGVKQHFKFGTSSSIVSCDLDNSAKSWQANEMTYIITKGDGSNGNALTIPTVASVGIGTMLMIIHSDSGNNNKTAKISTGIGADKIHGDDNIYLEPKASVILYAFGANNWMVM